MTRTKTRAGAAARGGVNRVARRALTGVQQTLPTGVPHRAVTSLARSMLTGTVRSAMTGVALGALACAADSPARMTPSAVPIESDVRPQQRGLPGHGGAAPVRADGVELGAGGERAVGSHAGAAGSAASEGSAGKRLPDNLAGSGVVGREAVVGESSSGVVFTGGAGGALNGAGGAAAPSAAGAGGSGSGGHAGQRSIEPETDGESRYAEASSAPLPLAGEPAVHTDCAAPMPEALAMTALAHGVRR
jgi:hypothetical protein